MDDWEDIDVSSAGPSGSRVPNTEWDDEDAEEEEEQAPQPVQPAQPLESTLNKPKKQKQKLQDKLKEREDREAEKSRQQVRERDAELEGLSEVERKLRLQKIVEESDLEHSKELFMAGRGEDVPQEEPKLDGYTPKTEDDHVKYGELVGKRLQGLRNARRGYPYKLMVEKVIRVSVAEMSPEDIKELAGALNVIANEKLKAKTDKNKKGKKGAAKKSIKVDKADDESAYSRMDDYDGFI